MARMSIPDIKRMEVPVDVKENWGNLPNLNCAPYEAEKVTDDRVIVETVALSDGRKALRFQFKSEIGGLFGMHQPLGFAPERLYAIERHTRVKGWASQILQAQEAYAPYAIYVEEGGLMYAKDAVAGLSQAVDASTDGERMYKIDEPDRMLMILAGVLACGGMERKDGWFMALGDQLMHQQGNIRTAGEDLPKPDQVKSQQKEAEPRFSDDCGIFCVPPL